ncbi:indoleacetamide hydrolase [Sulfitobacter albidus]|uniref:Indoleacetamide hydrolase n=1 Tax=Sulfitobacter albidus TaxID=2829501 RepID=A0A975JBM5_9RHOB|nr:indoleacetamide hydrolase [Sulfitobacter albidus]QUJ75280.1 indoleacetamide hydrolase [Sulfitobacter albidus]
MAIENRFGAAELLRKMDAQEISATEFAKDTVQREKARSSLNAISHFDPDFLVANAQRADEKRAAGINGVLCGLPVAAKDNINTVSFPTTAGTGALLHHTPRTNAGIVTAIEQADGFIGAKTGMHELAFGITSNNGTTGKIRNPHDPDMIPGGSSGGTAAAVAAGILPVGLGTDTGASVRLPAALCGVVGFRPTVGRYSGTGIVPISHTRDTAGPIARYVEDIALMDGVLAGQEPVSQSITLDEVVLGLPREVFFENLEPAVETAVQATLKTLEKAGAKLIEVSLSEIWPLNEAVGFPVALYEVMRDLPAYLAEHAPGISFDELVSKIGSPDVAGVIASQLGDDAIPEEAYRAAMDTHRPAMQSIYQSCFKDNGLTALAFPTSPLRARPIGDDETVELNGQQVPTFPSFIRNTDLGSNLAVPGISLPCPDVPGLPVGIEFEGRTGADRDLIALALAVEDALTR